MTSNEYTNHEYDVKDLGAVGDGMRDDTTAIQNTIDQCAKDGGGMVVLAGRGTFLSGALFLKQNVHFRIDAGAVLKAIEDQSLYPIINTRAGGFEMPWPGALLNAIDLEDVMISARGG